MSVLETDRLILKNGTIADWIKVHEYDFNYLMNIDGIFEYVKRTPEEIRGWFGNPDIKDIIKLCNNNDNYDFIIYIKETMEPIGYISFDRNNEELKSTEIACYLHPNYWRNGFMYEAIIKCMEYLFDLGFENIIYSYDMGNIKSKKLCEKLGFLPFKQQNENSCFGNPTIVYNNIMSKENYEILYKIKKTK